MFPDNINQTRKKKSLGAECGNNFWEVYIYFRVEFMWCREISSGNKVFCVKYKRGWCCDRY